jgi:hypothetical protein
MAAIGRIGSQQNRNWAGASNEGFFRVAVESTIHGQVRRTTSPCASSSRGTFGASDTLDGRNSHTSMA